MHGFGRGFYKDSSNINWFRWFGITILLLGIITSFCIYNFVHADNIHIVYGTVDAVTDNSYYVGGKYPIRFSLNNHEYEMKYEYSGRQYANANKLLDAITNELVLNPYVEMKVVESFGNPLILEIKCNDMVFGDFQVAHREYKNNAIEMSLFSILNIITGIFLLLYSLRK